MVRGGWSLVSEFAIALIWKVQFSRISSLRLQPIVRSLFAKKGHPRIVMCVSLRMWKVSSIVSSKI